MKKWKVVKYCIEKLIFWNNLKIKNNFIEEIYKKSKEKNNIKINYQIYFL